jgi:hypothetical protein
MDQHHPARLVPDDHHRWLPQRRRCGVLEVCVLSASCAQQTRFSSIGWRRRGARSPPTPEAQGAKHPATKHSAKGWQKEFAWMHDAWKALLATHVPPSVSVLFRHTTHASEAGPAPPHSVLVLQAAVQGPPAPHAQAPKTAAA